MLAPFMLLVTSAEPAEKIYHPDGRVGYAGGWVDLRYEIPDNGTIFEVNSRGRVEVGLKYPISRRFTFLAQYGAEKGDSLFHSYSLGWKYYFGNTVRDNMPVNPDGPTGVPIVEVHAGGRIPDINSRDHEFRASVEFKMPVSRNITIGLGGNYFANDNPYYVETVYGLFTYFPGRYLKGRVYENPDGPEGTPSFHLIGGGSKNGIFGQLDIVIPLKPQLTLVIYTRGERTPDPYLRVPIFGGRVNFYPSQK